MAKKTYVVKHPKLFLAVKGKLTKVEVGTEISLDEVHAKGLLDAGKIETKGKVKKADVGGEEETTTKEK